jgi:DNA-binding MarR family transcriptional regulator
MKPVTKAIFDLVNHIQLHQRDIVEQCREQTGQAMPVRTVSEFFVLKEIGDKGVVNACALSESLLISKSGISKITGRFLERGLISAGRRDGNEKEVYYSLTAAGSEAYEVQIKAGQEKITQMEAFLANFGEEEKEAILRYLTGVKKYL